MSSSAKDALFKSRAQESKQQREKYDAVVTEWKNSILSAYKNKKIKSSETFDTDAFYVISKYVNMDKSPFKLSQMSEQERHDYLETIDKSRNPISKEHKTKSSIIPILLVGLFIGLLLYLKNKPKPIASGSHGFPPLNPVIPSYGEDYEES
jgi:hypothetical protein